MKADTVACNYTLNPRLDDRASIGVVALATDATIERDWRQLLSIPGVGFYVGRIANDPEITADTLRAMESRITASLASLLPDSDLDCVVYACTSASTFIGEESVAALLRKARPGIRVTNPLTAAKAALGALGARRVAMLTPYMDEVNVRLGRALEDSGLDVSAIASFFNSRDPEVVRIDRDSIRRGALDLAGRGDADALFIACTALDACALVPELEQRTGLAVTTSNHAMAWHALRLCGVPDALDARGSLFLRAP